ncbi:hypothetical protein [Oceanobacillus kapialis]|uniref:hypothetical protein n=1 Tax=Oceanobacillus kapialis TaxID=481353 RepID=UPI00384BCE07
MRGKTAVFVLILVTIIAMIICWLWLQDVIVEYDLERALGVIEDGIDKHFPAHSQIL